MCVTIHPPFINDYVVIIIFTHAIEIRYLSRYNQYQLHNV